MSYTIENASTSTNSNVSLELYANPWIPMNNFTIFTIFTLQGISEYIKQTKCPIKSIELTKSKKSSWKARIPEIQRSCISYLSVYLYAFLFPFICLLSAQLLSGKDITDQIVFGLFLSCALPEIISNFIKGWYSSPRPRYASACNPNVSKIVKNSKEDKVIIKCVTPPIKRLKAMESFPSKHAAISFGGLSYLTLFFYKTTLGYKLKDLSCKIYYYSLLLTPILFACYVGVSRITDHAHYFIDVLGGIIIGLSCAYISIRGILHQTPKIPEYIKGTVVINPETYNKE